MDLKGLPGLGFDPFTIDVSYILLEERRIFQLAGNVSKCNRPLRKVSRAGRTGGMLWFGAMAYVLAIILGRLEG